MEKPKFYVVRVTNFFVEPAPSIPSREATVVTTEDGEARTWDRLEDAVAYARRKGMSQYVLTPREAARPDYLVARGNLTCDPLSTVWTDADEGEGVTPFRDALEAVGLELVWTPKPVEPWDPWA